MTDISKEAVEALAASSFSKNIIGSERLIAATLRALSARVEELEKVRIRMLNEKLSGQWHDDAFNEGRLQGLDEALAVTVPSTSWGTEGLPQKYAEAIEALKEQSND